MIACIYNVHVHVYTCSILTVQYVCVGGGGGGDSQYLPWDPADHWPSEPEPVLCHSPQRWVTCSTACPVDEHTLHPVRGGGGGGT